MMLIDYLEPDTDNDIACDVCIIGGGAAGITIAHELNKSNIDICVLESGGLEQDASIQSLYNGKSIGLVDPGPSACRLRYFGGTTNHWKGYCNTLSDIDFKPRSWVPNSGWPIRLSDLEPYYKKACVLCGIGPYYYFRDEYFSKKYKTPDFNSKKIHINHWQISKPTTRFGKEYRQELKHSRNVRIYLHANVRHFNTNHLASEITSVQLQTLSGKKGLVSAKQFILACGGIENPRLLLLSNGVQKNGLGNSNGLVGKFFNMHIEYAEVGQVMPNHNRQTFLNAFRHYSRNGVRMMADLSLSHKLQEKEKMLNCSFTLAEGKRNQEKTGYGYLRDIVKGMKSGNYNTENLSDHIWHIMSDLDAVGSGVYKHMKNMHVPNQEYRPALYVRAEAAPNYNSSISLGKHTDVLGQPEIVMNWQLSEMDKRSIRSSLLHIATEFGRLNLGRVQLNGNFFSEGWPQPLWGGCHHMGTTRMSGNPDQGVVNKDCRVHSVNNLYIAGSSVFPTGGYSTPTLTIVALSLRLAKHVKSKFNS